MKTIEEVGKNFEKGYFEDPNGTGPGSCGYEWDMPGVQYWLKVKWDFFQQYLGSKGIKKVLFIGCAKGFEVRYFRERGIDAWGVDISHYAIEHAEPEARPYCSVADVGDLSMFGDKSFDLVLSFCVLALLDTPAREVSLREMQRVAKDWILINWSVRPWFSPPVSETPDCWDGNPVYLVPLEEWVKLIEKDRKFHLWAGYLPPAETYSAWCIFKQGDYTTHQCYPKTLK